MSIEAHAPNASKGLADEIGHQKTKLVGERIGSYLAQTSKMFHKEAICEVKDEEGRSRRHQWRRKPPDFDHRPLGNSPAGFPEKNDEQVKRSETHHDHFRQHESPHAHAREGD